MVKVHQVHPRFTPRFTMVIALHDNALRQVGEPGEPIPIANACRNRKKHMRGIEERKIRACARNKGPEKVHPGSPYLCNSMYGKPLSQVNLVEDVHRPKRPLAPQGQAYK